MTQNSCSKAQNALSGAINYLVVFQNYSFPSNPSLNFLQFHLPSTFR